MTRAVVLGLFLSVVIAGNSYGQQVINGCPVLPSDSIWNTPIDNLPLLANSASMVSTIGASRGFHPDFGSGTWDGGPIGIPFITVPSSQPRFPASFFYSDESDPGPYAVPLDATIEGGPNATGDRHVLAVDTGNCILYEFFAAFPDSSSWTAGSGAIFDLRSNALRPLGWTSADAAGLPILPGLVTYDEVLSGEIKHAIRFTAPQTRREFVWPARHYASSLTGTQYPRMGERFRLKASFDISPYPAEVQVILRAMKKYGIMLADNGGAWFISGAPDPRWNDDNLHTLGQLRGSNFEAVDATTLQISADSGAARQSGVAVPVAPTVGVSSDGTQVPSASQITDAQGAIWTLSGDGMILRNGVHAAGGYGSKILWSGGEIRVVGTDGAWYRWTGSSWAREGATSASSTSAEGTRIPTVSQIVDSWGSVWTIGWDGMILLNGVHAAGGYGSQILWSGGEIRVVGTDGAWYRWTGSSWAREGATSASSTSAEGTRIPTVSQIVDSWGSVWTIGWDGMIILNGVHAAGGYGSQILWSGGVIYVFGTDSAWYRWTGSSWAREGATSVWGTSPDGTQVPSVSQIVDSWGSIWTIGWDQAILLNGSHAAGGYGSKILWSGGVIFVFGTDSAWYRWTGGGWTNIGS